MNAATEFDVGPLTWVKSEIDLALERADQALQQYTASVSAGTGDLTQIKFCRTHLHQVQGALTIIGLDGVMQFAEAVESLLDAVEKQTRPAGEMTIDLGHRSLEAIRGYLDDLVSGQPNQPLRLLSLYNEVQKARGVERFSPSDLFFPDLGIRPPRREALAQKMSRGDFERLLRQERARFQRGLLSWLLSPQNRSGVSEMLGAVKRIEATQDAASARSFWWVAIGFLSALAEGSLPAEANVKQLCARIDLQIRRLIEGSKNVAERLMRDALYFVANAESNNGAVQQVKQTFHLQDVIPPTEAIAPAPQEAIRRRLREVITATEEAWNKFCSGTSQSLPLFREHAVALSAAVEQLGHTDYRRLARAIVAAANWLNEDSSRHSDGLSMEIATAILLAQNAQENYQRLGSDFAHQVDVTVARIHACIAGTAPQPGSEIPLLDEMSRKAQEKLLIGQVAKEIQNNLAQIEQVLDGFFRDSDKRGELAALQTPLHQVAGALTIMRQDGAVTALLGCTEEIRRFSSPDYVPQEADFERVANELSIIGFFIDSMQHGAEDFDAFIRQMQPVAEPLADEGEEVEAGEAEGGERSVEQEVEQQKRETHALLGALMEQPDDAGLREEVKQNLAALQSDADLVADVKLGEQAKAMLSVLESGEAAAPQIEQAMATLQPQAAEAPKPSAEVLQLSQASNEEIDAELLGIFLEEAHEVLGTIDGSLQDLRDQPHNIELLTTIRRSFHTLKGSGRMVGLKDVGEAAWAIEQTLNIWLRQELAVTPVLFDLIDLARTVFSDWVRHLETQAGTAPDPAALTSLAESLRQTGNESPQATPSADMTQTIVTRFIQAEMQAPEVAAQDAGEISLDFPPIATGVDDSVESPMALPELPEETEAMLQETVIVPLNFDTGMGGADAAATVEEAIDFSAFEFDAVSAANAESLEISEPVPSAGDLPSATILEFAPVAVPEETIYFEVMPVAVPEEEKPETVVEEVDATLPVEPASEESSRPAPSPGLIDIFSEEARTHLATLWRELPSIESETVVPTPHEMYRAAHTLAGISSTLGLTPVNQLGHALELALLRRDHSAHPGSLEALGLIRQTIGELDLMLTALLEQREIGVPPDLVDALDGLYPAQILPHDAEPDPDDVAPELPAEMAKAAATVATKTELTAPLSFVAGIPRLKDEIDEQLLPIFLEEALDLNQGITAQLRVWRGAPANLEAVRTLTRLLHTLKGSARMAGAMNLGEITHAIETRVEEASRAGTTPMEVIDGIENAFDDVLQIIDRLNKGESLEASVPAVGDESVAAATIPGDTIRPAVSTTETGPPVPAAPGVTHERRTSRIRFDEAEADVAAGEGAQRATLRVRANLVDRLVNEAGELSIARARIEGEMHSLKDSLLDLTENVIRLRRQLRDIEIQAESQMQSRNAQADVQHAGFDPLEFDRFTRFQEITRMMAESVNDVATVQQNLLKNLDDANAAILAQARLNREIQQELMSVRMVPFGSLADRLYRIVRQTSKELNKRANLELAGSQVELDRSVLDKMGAPLEHMLRNAIAHGLEDRETRLARGKQDIGEISVAVRQEGNEVILSFADDGAGLNYARIRERAIEAGLLAADETASDERLAEMIFMPGFSTASEISQIAGRGVGMDVVKNEVTSLGGRIEITSEPGQGTEFRLYIPLTLAVTKALIVRAGNRRYAIPSVMIEQVLDLKEAAVNRIREAGSAEWLGHHYPFSFLPHLLGDPRAVPEEHRQYWIMLLRSGTRRIAVQVDELMGNKEIVVKNIGPQLARVIGIDGATVLGDGQVVLILNPIALSTRAPVALPAMPAAAIAEPVAQEPVTRLPTVMVVDDSLTVRKITGRLLAREGYQVLTAKDGVEALEMLIEVMPDVMLVDIEMPRLDGFDLTRNIRADARLKHVPIIMITSRTAEKHRTYAFEIGVNHYLGKPYQEDELLQLVAEYISQRAVA